ncbi:MAG: Rnase Y domain-containing protein, partial [Verrucomicrobia bacterium]|nr:Rnase Y domain-containing protein [Verrucomicrobiota bacterium]
MIGPLLGVVVGLGAGYAARVVQGKQGSLQDETRAKRQLDDAQREARTILKEAEVQVKAERLKAREDFEESTADRRKELQQLEERLSQREVNVDRKVALLDKKEATIEGKLAEIEQRQQSMKSQQDELQRMIDDEREKLQRVAGMTRDEAKNVLLSRVERDIQGETAGLIRRIQEQAKETAERDAARIVTVAIQRYAGSHASESMSSSIALPSDEMKGRVIGREGRNIRALEAATGVNVLIDDTPEAVVITAFDPVRREIAKQALEQLVADGRIHPARIEEVVERVQQSMDETIRQAGEEAAYEVGCQDVDPELLRKLGALRYRTSYSQNVLRHSVEVAHLMGLMAGELGLDIH